MDDPWEHLRNSVFDSVEWIWSDFAKEGAEGAILRPLGEHSDAAAWVAESLAMSKQCISRKLGAMLAGWVFDSEYRTLLAAMLKRERVGYRSDPLAANSVAEDIMFSATRWTTCGIADMKEAGLAVLAAMVYDAMNSVPWNTAHWAAANLYAVFGKQHPALIELSEMPTERIAGQPFLIRIAEALRTANKHVLDEYHSEPTQAAALSSEHPRFSLASGLWAAASKAQAALES